MGLIDDVKIMKNQILGEGKYYGYKSIACNRLYLIFCFIGYYLVSDKISKSMKFLWGAYVYVHTGIMIFTCIHFFFFHDLTADLTYTVYMLFIMVLGMGMSVFLPLIIWYFSNDFMEVLSNLDEIIDDDYEEKIVGDFSDYDRMKEKIVTTMTIAVFLFCFAVFYFICYVDAIVFPSQEKYLDYRYSLIPCYRPELIYNLRRFLFFNSAAAFGAVGIASQIVFNNWLFEYLAVIIHNETIILSKYMRHISEVFEDEIEKLSTIPVETDWMKNVQIMHKPKFDEFLLCFMKSIQRYQALIRCFSTIRPYFQVISTAMIIGLFYMQLANAFMVLSDNPPVILMREIAAVGLTMRSFYSLCSLGQTLEDLNEMITLEVFSLPWYRLPIKDRKTVLNFLCQVQYLLKCNVFGILPVNHNTFLGFNRLTYSYTNILRTMQMKD